MKQLQLATRHPWDPQGPAEEDARALNSTCDPAVNILSTRSENRGHTKSKASLHLLLKGK